MQVARHDGIQCRGLQCHRRGDCVDQLAVGSNIRIILRDFVENFVPQHHSVALRVGLGDQREVLARAFFREFESKAVDPFHALAREDRGLGRDFVRQSPVNAAARAGVFALGVFADDDPVDLAAFEERAGDPGQHPGGPHVGVLVEALADRQAQAPQRHMVGHVRRADCAEEDRIELLQRLQGLVRHVGAGLEEALRAPVEWREMQGEAVVLLRERLQDLLAFSDDFDADAVARDGRDPVGLHAAFFEPSARMASATAAPTSEVLALPPMSGVRGPSTITVSMPRITAAAASA